MKLKVISAALFASCAFANASVVYLPLQGVKSGYGWALGISDVGKVVTGTVSDSATYQPQAFRFEVGVGATLIEPLAAAQGWTANGVAISGDGSTVIGRSESWGPITGYSMFKWSPSSGTVRLGSAFQVIDMSADGSVAVGMDDAYRALRWTASTGLVNMAPQPRFANERVTAITRDGRVVLGHGGATTNGSDWQPFLWTESTGYTVLPGAPNAPLTLALRISDDHSTIAGIFGDSEGHSHIYRWTEEGGYEDLGGHPEYPGGELLTTVTGISGDGEVIVGQGFNRSAFVWNEAQGMVTARQYFLNHGIDVPDVNNLAVSRDGQKFFGTTFDGQAFIATVPEPGSTAALLFGAATILARRRQSDRRN